MIRKRAKSVGRPLVVVMLILMTASAWAYGPTPQLGDEFGLDRETPLSVPASDRAYGDPIDFVASMTAGADYLRGMQADITDDNAGNGTDGVDEYPDDPDDGGWDWRVTSPPAPFHHTDAASSLNLYGATGQGLYHAYLATGDVAYMVALTDAADAMVANTEIRSGSDLVFLLLYQDLPEVTGTIYADSARAKYDGRISQWGSATGLAEYIRDVRGVTQGYPNGIIAWDIGVWAKAAMMLHDRFPGEGYDTDAADIAEVIWQDSFNDNPGYFDIIDDQGYDPDYLNVDYYWYSLGITGLIQAFHYAQVHTDEIPGLVTILLECVDSYGGVSYSYGGFDADWQSSAYGALCLAELDPATHALDISKMGNFLVITQDESSGGWVYASGNHYPEIGGECTAAISFGTAPVDVIVDDDFTDQADVDLHNAAHGTGYVFGYDAFGTIQNGLDMMTAGGNLFVALGTYPETVMIGTAFNGGTLIGELGSIPLVTGGLTIADGTTGVTVRNLHIQGTGGGSSVIRLLGPVTDHTFDGCIVDGQLVSGRHGVSGGLFMGDLTVLDCEFKEILGWSLFDTRSGSGGSGSQLDHVIWGRNRVHDSNGSVVFRGEESDWTDTIDIYDSVWENIGGNGGETGDHWAAFEANRAVDVNVWGNRVQGVAMGTWEGQAAQFWGITDLDAHHNLFTGCAEGIWISGLGGVYELPGGSFRHNTIAGNGYGILANNHAGGVVDALHNLWGDVTGPLHPTLNPAGLGNSVSDDVLFDPWLSGNVIFNPDPQLISLTDDIGGGIYRDGVVCQYLGGGSGPLYGYSIDLTWNNTVIDAGVADFSKPVAGPFASPTLFIVQDLSAGATGHVRIDAALPGTELGILTGELFQAEFTAVGIPDYTTSEVTIIINEVRDSINQPLTGFAGDDGLYVVDLAGPSVTGVTIVNDTLDHTDDYVKDTDAVTVTATVTDGDPGFGPADIRADLTGFGGGAAVSPASYVAGLATWTVSGVTCTPADGVLTVTVNADDGLGNTGSGGDDIIADNTLPRVLTDFTSSPGHNEIHCSWSDATGSDLHYYRTELMEAPWGDYPDYATPPPGYPGVGTARWSGLDSVITLTYDPDGLERDIMYLQVYSVDWALNYNAPNGSAQDRATNYWLGDVSDEVTGLYGIYDGYVTVADMTQLGTYYGTYPFGNAGDEVNVGPTDDWSRTGIPLPDPLINFEDLMIFSMNYHLVTPLPVFQEGATERPRLVWRRLEEEIWVLELTEPCQDLKGLNLSSDLPAGSVLDIQPGSLCDLQAGVVFLKNIDANGLDAGLALMGGDLNFIGSGELLRVSFVAGLGPVAVEVLARSSVNQPLVPEMETTAAADAVPTVYRLAQNYPNPFNPTTSISFDLPETQDVKLGVFGPDGRKIVTLVNESMPAGFHAVTWNGRDRSGSRVASGIYFYRIEAGPLRRTCKMLMLK